MILSGFCIELNAPFCPISPILISLINTDLGTEHVLKALRNEGIKVRQKIIPRELPSTNLSFLLFFFQATFFINSQYLHDKDPSKAARAKNILLATIV
jgi:hypothetical protein